MPTLRSRRTPALAVAAILLSTLPGCQARFGEAPPPVAPLPESPEPLPSFTITGAQYAEAFDAAKGMLRDHRFQLDRIDARAGVITSRPASSAGYFTPWIRHTASTAEAVDASLNRERRIAAVGFAPADDSTVDDLRSYQGDIAVTVGVAVERVLTPGARHTTTSIRLSSTYTNPAWLERDMQPHHAVFAGIDLPLAERMRENLSNELLASDLVPN